MEPSDRVPQTEGGRAAFVAYGPISGHHHGVTLLRRARKRTETAEQHDVRSDPPAPGYREASGPSRDLLQPSRHACRATTHRHRQEHDNRRNSVVGSG